MLVFSLLFNLATFVPCQWKYWAVFIAVPSVAGGKALNSVNKFIDFTTVLWWFENLYLITMPSLNAKLSHIIEMEPISMKPSNSHDFTLNLLMLGHLPGHGGHSSLFKY